MTSDSGRGTPITPPLDDGALPGNEGAPGEIPPTVLSAFHSILSDTVAGRTAEEVRTQPAYFPDLNFDQLLESIVAGREQYELTPFFYEHLDDPDTISYRQEVFRDLEHPAIFHQFESFGRAMSDMRAALEQMDRLRYRYQRESWFVDAVEFYCRAVKSLASELVSLDLKSRGLTRLRDYLADYVQTPMFTSLLTETQHVKQSLSTVEYTIQINGGRCTVARYEGQADYGAEVLATFERFKQGAAKDYRVGFRDPPEMNHIETNVLGLVAKLYPTVFAALDDYCAHHENYLDATIRRFDREVQFYLSYLEYLRPFRAAGLCFCYPEITRRSKEVLAKDAFDLALADKLVPQNLTVVTNDLFLTNHERIFVVSGPNQGGKTTFARMFAQLHHLAAIGYLVPGREARLYLYDQLFTQFEREEDPTNMTGKLEDDLMRIKTIFFEATPDSIIVLNEVFASTTLQDSAFLGKKVMQQLVELDLLCVFVTFVEELASSGPSVVSMVSTIVPENPTTRTYKVLRKPADGLAYALAIAEKYGLTYDVLKKRVSS